MVKAVVQVEYLKQEDLWFLVSEGTSLSGVRKTMFQATVKKALNCSILLSLTRTTMASSSSCCGGTARVSWLHVGNSCQCSGMWMPWEWWCGKVSRFCWWSWRLIFSLVNWRQRKASRSTIPYKCYGISAMTKALFEFQGHNKREHIGRREKVWGQGAPPNSCRSKEVVFLRPRVSWSYVTQGRPLLAEVHGVLILVHGPLFHLSHEQGNGSVLRTRKRVGPEWISWWIYRHQHDY